MTVYRTVTWGDRFRDALFCRTAELVRQERWRVQLFRQTAELVRQERWRVQLFRS